MLGTASSGSLKDASSILGTVPVLSVTFSPDAEAIACSHEDGSVSLYAIAGAQLCLMQALPQTSSTQASCIAFLNTETLVVARATGQVEVWDLVRLQRLFEFPSPLGDEACTKLCIANDRVVCGGRTSACILQVGQ